MLSSKPTKEVPPHGLLYIGQREMAVVSPEDGNFLVNIFGDTRKPGFLAMQKQRCRSAVTAQLIIVFVFAIQKYNFCFS